MLSPKVSKVILSTLKRPCNRRAFSIALFRDSSARLIPVGPSVTLPII